MKFWVVLVVYSRSRPLFVNAWSVTPARQNSYIQQLRTEDTLGLTWTVHQQHQKCHAAQCSWLRRFWLSTADPVLSAPATITHTDFKTAATCLFSIKGSEVHAIRNLLSHQQCSDETVGNYLAELHSLAKCTSLAQFTHEQQDTESYILAAMLALGIQSRVIQQWLLREEQVTLQAFYKIAASAETAKSDQRMLSNGQNKQVNNVMRHSALQAYMSFHTTNQVVTTTANLLTNAIKCLHVMQLQWPPQQQRTVSCTLQHMQQMW